MDKFIDILQTAGAIALGLVMAFSGFVGGLFQEAPLAVGGANQVCFTSAKPTRLSGAGVSASASSIGLVDFEIRGTGQGLIITDFCNTTGFGTIAPGTSKQEFISFKGITQSGDGTATLTGVARGLAPISPYSASTTLQQQHSGGVRFIISNNPSFYTQFQVPGNLQTITNIHTYGATTTPRYNQNPTFDSSSLEFASMKHIGDIALAGAGTSTESSSGLVVLADTVDASNSVASTTSGLPLVLLSRYSTTTPDPSTQTAFLVMANSSNGTTIGTINENVIATSSPYNWTGDHTFTQATSTAFDVTDFSIGGSAFIPRFGGTGSDGALNTSGGTVDINLGGNAYVEKNFTSINIATNVLTFSNPATKGTVVILRSQGDVTITDTITANFGGSAGASVSGAGADGEDGSDNDDILDAGSHFGAKGEASGTAGTAGTVLTTTGLAVKYTTASTTLHRRAIMITSGSGAGSGSNSSGGDGSSGAGGVGGGGLFIEVAGSLNFTGTINMDGADGGNGSGGSGLPAGGGGGGGGGQLLILYNTLTANSGTVTIAGGDGGDGASASNGTATGDGGGGGGAGVVSAGGAGSAGGAQNVSAGNASAGGGASGGTGGTGGTSDGSSDGGGGAGGGGGTGSSFIIQNIWFQ